MKSIASLYLATCLGAFAGTPSPVIGSPLTTPEESSGWRVRTALYLWAQSLGGNLTVRDTTVPVDLGFKDLAEDLDMAVMGLVEVSNGRWGFLLDVNYADISDTFPTRFGTVTESVDFNQKQWLLNGWLRYNVVRDGCTAFDVFAGARFNAIEVDIETDNREFSGDASWVDPVVGLRFQRNLTTNLYFRAVGDIGGFGVSSDLTWQAMAGFGWRFNDACSLLLGYRAIDTDYSHDGFRYDVNARGPVLGLEITF